MYSIHHIQEMNPQKCCRAKRTVEPVLDDFDGDESSLGAAGAAVSDTEEQEEQPVESVLSEIAKDEIDEVRVHRSFVGRLCEFNGPRRPRSNQQCIIVQGVSSGHRPGFG